MVQTFFGNSWLFPAQNISLLAVQLLGLFTSLIKVLSVSEHNSFILKFHCFILPLNLIPNIICSEGLFRYGTNISKYV